MWCASRFHTGSSFVPYLNLRAAIKYSEVHHFADDTNVPNFNISESSIHKQVNFDLKQIENWLQVNKISLNVGKTELVLFALLKKQPACDLKIKLNGKRLYETDSVKYLGNLNCQKINMETTY